MIALPSFIGLAYLLACINLIDVQKLNDSVLAKNLYISYDLELPVIDQGISIRSRFNYDRIYLYFSKDGLGNIIPYTRIRALDCPIDSLENRLYDPYSIEISSPTKKVMLLVIDQQMSMKYVRQLRSILSKDKDFIIEYSVLEKRKKPISTRIGEKVVRTIFYEKGFCQEEVSGLSNINLYIKGDSVNLENHLIPVDSLTKHLKEQFLKSSSLCMKLEYDENLFFSDYLKAYGSLIESVRNFRADTLATNTLESLIILE